MGRFSRAGDDLQRISTEELEHRLVQRWVYQGVLMGLVLVFAILAVVLVSGETEGGVRQVMAGVLVGLGTVNFIVFQVHRLGSRRIQAELHRRRHQDQRR